MSLRSKIIRLAHSNPELRPDLLPLLRTQGKAAGASFRFIKGQQYEVIRRGGSLSWWEAAYPVGHTGKNVNLPVGALLTYTGRRMGIGSDNVPIDSFEWPKKRVSGEFWPNSWGLADKRYLRPVEGKTAADNLEVFYLGFFPDPKSQSFRSSVFDSTANTFTKKLQRGASDTEDAGPPRILQTMWEFQTPFYSPYGAPLDANWLRDAVAKRAQQKIGRYDGLLVGVQQPGINRMPSGVQVYLAVPEKHAHWIELLRQGKTRKTRTKRPSRR